MVIQSACIDSFHANFRCWRYDNPTSLGWLKFIINPNLFLWCNDNTYTVCIPLCYKAHLCHFFLHEKKELHSESCGRNSYIYTFYFADQRPNKRTAQYAGYIFQKGTLGSADFIPNKNILSDRTFAAFHFQYQLPLIP